MTDALTGRSGGSKVAPAQEDARACKKGGWVCRKHTGRQQAEAESAGRSKDFNAACFMQTVPSPYKRRGENHLSFKCHRASPGKVMPLFTKIKLKTMGIMEKFMKMMEKDFQKVDFTKKEMVVYGIIVPVVLIAITAIAGWLESL
jgi:hypothetical protein